MRVLIADDDPDIVKLLALRLKRWGYESTVARSGHEALEALAADPGLHMVISDWMMPGMDGVELCRRIRQMEGRSYTYVMLLTARDREEDLLQAFQAGADEFVRKPFQPRELQMRLEVAKRLLVQMSKSGPTTRALAPQQGMLVGGRYRLTTLLGAGGMGTVWAAEHLALGSKVAIKFLRPEQAEREGALARFETEARVAAWIASPSTVRVFDYGVGDDGVPYLVMEHFRGCTLADEVEKGGPMTPKAVAKIVRDVATALTRAHEAGVIHRDVKPANVFLAESDTAGGEFVTKLIDFGVAKVIMGELPPAEAPSSGGRPVTMAGMMLGTPHFMSPEYLETAEPDTNLDVWGLAATAYYALVGAFPFDGDNFCAVLQAICAAPLPVPSAQRPDVPVGFDAWFAKACAHDPAARFATAQDLARALEAVCSAVPRTSVIATAPPVSIAVLSSATTMQSSLGTERSARPATSPEVLPRPASAPPSPPMVPRLGGRVHAAAVKIGYVLSAAARLVLPV